MYMRIVRASPQADQAEELGRRWEAFVGAQMKQMAGFRHAHFGRDRATNTTASVSVWDTKPNEAALATLVADFREQVTDIVGGPPEIVDYEILVEV